MTVVRTLDYGSSDPFSHVIGRARDLAWPVHAYRVTIPATLTNHRHRLNPFEKAVLGMIDAVGGHDESTLAHETLIPFELVRGIILRLRDKGLIDGNNKIIDQQRPKWDNDEQADIYTSAMVFRELVGGRLLPFVHVLDESNPVKTKEIVKSAWRLDRQGSAHTQGVPSAREVIDAIKQMMRRYQEHQQTSRIPSIEQTRVEREPEYYLLHCQIAVQAHDADFRIADPFGLGFSRTLEGVYRSRLKEDERLQKWMRDWLANLAKPRQGTSDPSRTKPPYDTPENRRRYPKLVNALSKPPGADQRSVTGIYAALEWALYYVCEAHSPSVAIHRLSAESGPGYSACLSQIADSLGFVVPKSRFRPLLPGKFQDYENGKSEMETVLAMALMQAESDREHPVHALAASHPEFIVRIRKLERDRGNSAHGSHVTLNKDTELESDAFMRRAVNTLLPAVRFDDSDPSPPRDSHADLLLDARASLLEAFGYQSFARFGPDAQNALLNAERFWLVSQDGDDAREFVVSLYSALQGVLRGFSSEAARLDCTEDDYLGLARRRAEKAGLGELPDTFTSVNPRRIREALGGNDLSLGASVIACLLTTDDDRLAALAHAQPTFLADIGEVQKRRGHGNEPTPMAKVDATVLRRSAFSTLETLLDLTN